VAAAESAAVRQNDPPESSFDSISAANISKLNRPTMRAAYREHTDYVSLPALAGERFVRRLPFQNRQVSRRPVQNHLFLGKRRRVLLFAFARALEESPTQQGESWTRMPCFRVRARSARTVYAVRV